MANEMRTFVKIISNNKEVSYKLQELFRYRQGNNEADALDVINYINGTCLFVKAKSFSLLVLLFSSMLFYF
jgi:hypothetical protein